MTFFFYILLLYALLNGDVLTDEARDFMRLISLDPRDPLLH